MHTNAILRLSHAIVAHIACASQPHQASSRPWLRRIAIPRRVPKRHQISLRVCAHHARNLGRVVARHQLSRSLAVRPVELRGPARQIAVAARGWLRSIKRRAAAVYGVSGRVEASSRGLPPSRRSCYMRDEGTKASSASFLNSLLKRRKKRRGWGRYHSAALAP